MSKVQLRIKYNSEQSCIEDYTPNKHIRVIIVNRIRCLADAIDLMFCFILNSHVYCIFTKSTNSCVSKNHCV